MHYPVVTVTFVMFLIASAAALWLMERWRMTNYERSPTT